MKKEVALKAEFDLYIKDYRSDLDNLLKLTGETSSFFAEYKALKLKEWLGQKALTAKTILDFGCGDGLMTYFVSKYLPHATVYGVDPSPDSVKVAQENYPNLKLTVNYDEKPDLDFHDAHFDIVFAAGAFHHIPFKNHEGYLKEIFRVLKPDGSFVMFELNPLNPLTQLTFRRSPVEANAKMLLPSYGKRMLQKHKDNRSISRKFYFFFPRFLRWLRPLEKFLTKIPFGGLYAVVIKK
jgi:ubiquinone/menaquinone biosynthesis C-methylase UbiE